MNGPLSKAILLGLGLFDLTREKAKKLADELVKRGEVAKDEKPEFLKKLLKRRKEAREEIGKLVEERVGKALSRLNIATKSDLDELKRAVGRLSKKMKR